MACGVTTLGSNSGAIPEVIGHATAIFPHSDAPSVADRLSSALNDPTLAQSQLTRTRTLYTHDAVATRWATFITQQLAA